jgi:RHS repeat-associated protein
MLHVRRLVTIDRMLSQAVAIALLPLLACASVQKRGDENSLPVLAHALSETRVRAIDEATQDCIKAEADHSPRRYREIELSWCELASGGWDARDTLTTAVENGAEVGRYDYRWDGLRVKRNAQSQQVEYFLDDKFVLSEHDGSTSAHSMKRRYHYGAQPLAESEVTGASRFTTWLNTDAQGSVTDATQSDGTVRTSRQYDPWGNYRNGTAPGSGDPELGHTGHQFDPETGFLYSQARYRDPELGIFISRDPREPGIRDAPWLHRYAYVRGNPLRYTDPDGTCTANAEGYIDCISDQQAAFNAEWAASARAGREGDYGFALGHGLLGAAQGANVLLGGLAQLPASAWNLLTLASNTVDNTYRAIGASETDVHALHTYLAVENPAVLGAAAEEALSAASSAVRNIAPRLNPGNYRLGKRSPRAESLPNSRWQ